MSLMAVPSYIDLCREVGIFLGWKDDDVSSPTGWALDARKLARVNRNVNDGLRRFYFETDGYVWSFLRPVASITVWPTIVVDAANIDSLAYSAETLKTTVTMDSGWASSFFQTMRGRSAVFEDGAAFAIDSADGLALTLVGDASGHTDGFTITADGDYRLPETFGGISGKVTFGTGAQRRPVAGTSNYRIRALRSSGMTGVPYEYACVPVHSDGQCEQEFDLQLYPIPNEIYTLIFRTNVRPCELSVEKPYPLGSAIHATAIKEACLMEAELSANDAAGIHSAAFLRAVASAKRADAKMLGVDFLGDSCEQSESSDVSLVIFDG